MGLMQICMGPGVPASPRQDGWRYPRSLALWPPAKSRGRSSKALNY